MIRLWIPLLLLAACSRADWSDPATVAAATADVQIIEAIVTHQAEDWAQRFKLERLPTLLVLNEIDTVTPSVWLPDRAQANGYGWGRPETWDAFFAASARSLSIPPRLNTAFQLVSERQVDRAFGRHDEWHGDAIGYPDSQGYFSFASLTLSEDGTEAIVLVSYECGALCGSGSIYHLVLEGGVWRIAHEKGIWVS